VERIGPSLQGFQPIGGLRGVKFSRVLRELHADKRTLALETLAKPQNPAGVFCAFGQSIMKTLPTLFLPILLAAAFCLRPTSAEAQFTFVTNNGTITITGYPGPNYPTTVVIPSTTNGLLVTSITNYAFSDTEVASVIIPNSVTNICADAFWSCDWLTNVLIGTGVQSIGSQAFEDCPELKKVYFLGDAPGSIGSYVFSGSSVTAYYLPSATGWGSTFAGIPAVPWNPLPAPSITTYNNQPVVLYPVPATSIIGTNYALQMSTNLTSGNWVTVTNGVSFICVQITNAPSSAFFQLRIQNGVGQ
jgi:hypothetical protein